MKTFLLLFAFIALLLHEAELRRDNLHTYRYDGDVNIGILVNLHHSTNSRQCGGINLDVVQQVVAAKWAVDIINNRSLSHEPKIGLQVHDTCNDGELVEKHLYHVISATRDFAGPLQKEPPILGLLSLGASDSLRESSGALFAFSIPLISVSKEGAAERRRLLGKYDNLLTTVPDKEGQIRALIELARAKNIRSLSLISSDHEASKVFVAEATTMGVSVPRILELSPGARHRDLTAQTATFVEHSDSLKPAIAMLVTSDEATLIAEELIRMSGLHRVRPRWLLGVLGIDMSSLGGGAWRAAFHKAYLAEPDMPELVEFGEHFLLSLENSDHNMRELIEEYLEEVFSCSSSSLSCADIPRVELERRFQQDPYISFVVKAVSALTAAYRLAQLDRCSTSIAQEADCLTVNPEDLHERVLDNLKKLSFSSMMKKKTSEVDGDDEERQHFSSSGRLVAGRQQIFVVDRDQGLKQIGFYSDDKGLRVTGGALRSITATIANDVKSSPLVKNVVVVDDQRDEETKEEARSTFGRPIGSPPHINNDSATTSVSRDEEEEVEKSSAAAVFPVDDFIGRTWVIAAIAVAVFGVFVSLWMMTFVMTKICNGSLSRNQIMGLILLAGVALLYASIVPWLLPPDESVCAARHFLHPLVLTLCFAVLLVKSMQLRSLLSIGLGGTLPQVNQLVSLFFMVVVQVVIAVEWYTSTSPIATVIDEENYPRCGVSGLRFLLLHVYPCVLMLLAFFYAVSVINFKHNYNEGRLIAFCLIFVIPVFIIFLIVHNFASSSLRDLVVVVALLLIASLIIAVIFIPKMIAIFRETRSNKKWAANNGGGLYTPYWPQWNSNSGMLNTNKRRQSWTPNKWFQSYRPSYRPFSDLHPLYGGGGSGSAGSFQSAGWPQQGPQQQQTIYSIPARKAMRTAAASARLHQANQKKTSTPKKQPHASSSPTKRVPTSAKRFNGMNYFTSSSPVSYYYYGYDRDPNCPACRIQAAAAAGVSPAEGTFNTTTTGKRLRKNESDEEAKKVPCRCCSQGNRPLAQRDAATTAVRGSAGTSSGGGRIGGGKGGGGSSSRTASSSLPSLVEAECYPGTVIITPDNNSYNDNAIWSHKYETR